MKQATSIFLMLLLLINSSGITFAQHFCGEYKMMEEITLGEKQLSCGMVMESSSCGDEEDEAHDCCDNQFITVDTDDDFSNTDTFSLDFQQDFVVAFVAVFTMNAFNFESTSQPLYAEYNPPPLIKNIPVLYEIFLI